MNEPNSGFRRLHNFPPIWQRTGLHLFSLVRPDLQCSNSPESRDQFKSSKWHRSRNGAGSGAGNQTGSIILLAGLESAVLGSVPCTEKIVIIVRHNSRWGARTRCKSDVPFLVPSSSSFFCSNFFSFLAVGTRWIQETTQLLFSPWFRRAEEVKSRFVPMLPF